jgi:hypothetical protein
MGGAEGARPAAGQRGSRLDGDLLTEHRTDGELETVERPCYPQARQPAHDAGEHGILGQDLRHRIGRRAEIEQVLDPHDHRTDHRRKTRRELDLERRCALGERHRDESLVLADGDRAPIMRRIDRLHTRNGPQA